MGQKRREQPSVAGNSARQAHGAEPGPIHLPLASEPSDHKSGGLGRGEQHVQITQMDLPNKYIRTKQLIDFFFPFCFTTLGGKCRGKNL